MDKPTAVPDFRAVPGLLTVLVTVALPIALGTLVLGEVGAARFVNYPLHALAEGFGAFVAITLSAVILFLERESRLPPVYAWVATGLVVMGTLDGFHAAVPAGQSFVSLHSFATFVGGLLFTGVWIPERLIGPWQRRWLVPTAFGLALVTGMLLVAWPRVLPDMVADGQFTSAAELLNIGGGIGFFVAAAFFLRATVSGAAVFTSHCLLFGVAGILFEFSVLWDAGWWLWHGLRLLAYGVAGIYFFRLFLASLRAQRENEERFRDIAHAASDWFWETGPDLRLSFVSDRIEDVTGRPPASFLGRTHAETTGLDEPEGEWEVLGSVLARRGAFRNFHYGYMGRGGLIQHMAISGLPVFDPSGAFAGYRGTGTDVSQLVEAHQLLTSERDRAETASRAKSEFLAQMSHELRTPLNAILGFSEALGSQYFGPAEAGKYREYARDIHSSADQLLGLVNDLLDLAAIEAGKKTLDLETFPLADLIRDCVRILDNGAYSKGVNLADETPDLLPDLRADKRAVRQILLNLLSNAVKFTPANGNVTVRAAVEGVYVRVTVRDTGPGIAPEILPHITDPFTRGVRTPYQRDDGWGLGLSITKSLVDLHNGILEIDSRMGSGTAVTVRLPCKGPAN